MVRCESVAMGEVGGAARSSSSDITITSRDSSDAAEDLRRAAESGRDLRAVREGTLEGSSSSDISITEFVGAARLRRLAGARIVSTVEQDLLSESPLEGLRRAEMSGCDFDSFRLCLKTGESQNRTLVIIIGERHVPERCGWVAETDTFALSGNLPPAALFRGKGARALANTEAGIPSKSLFYIPERDVRLCILTV
jgi:hypothetical protein